MRIQLFYFLNHVPYAKDHLFPVAGSMFNRVEELPGSTHAPGFFYGTGVNIKCIFPMRCWFKNLKMVTWKPLTNWCVAMKVKYMAWFIVLWVTTPMPVTWPRIPSFDCTKH